MEMLVLADDFTGALDTGIQFRKFGAGTKVTADPDYEFSASEDAQVLVIDTETRHQTKEKAEEIVRRIVRRAVEAGIRRIYKKTDSALRGNVGAELEAVLTASGAERIHFIPAFPTMNRIVEDGILYIDGVPVAQSVFGRDPFDPVRCSGVADILGQQTSLPVTVTGLIRSDTEGIIVYNARTVEDITGLVSQLGQTDGILLLAGCAGLASCLGSEVNGRKKAYSLDVLREYSGLLVICGSVNGVTKCQLERAEEAGFRRVRLNNRQKLTDWIRTPEGAGELEKWQRQSRECRGFLIDTNDLPAEESASAWGRRNGLNVLEVGERAADTLAAVAHSFLDSGTRQLLLLTGGDVLFHTMRDMDVTELTPLAEVEPGVILAEFRYRESTLRVLTKSGGFGTEDVMIRIAGQLIDCSERSEKNDEEG